MKSWTRAAARWLAAPLALVAAAVAVGALLTPASARPIWWRTVALAGTAAAVASALGVGYAWCVAAWRLPGRRWLAALAVGPLLVPPYVAALAWVDLLGPAGWIAHALGLATVHGPASLAPSWVYSVPSAGVLLGGCLFPLVALAAGAALRRLPASALEAARLARGPAGVRRVAAAALAPVVVPSALAVGVLASVELAVPQLLRVRTLSEVVHTRFDADADPVGALRAALPLLVLAAAAVAAGVLASRRRWPSGAAPLEPRAVSRARAGAALAGCALALSPGLFAPLATLGLRLFGSPTAPPPGGGPAPDALTQAARAIEAATTAGAPDAARSATVGILAALIGVTLAGALAWRLRWASRRVLTSIAAATAVLAATPSLIGIALLVALNREPVAPALDSLGVVVASALIRFGALAGALAWVGVRSVPRGEQEAARLAGRDPRWQVVLPQAAPYLAAAALLLYVLAVTEYPAASLLAPPGKSLLSVFVVNEAHYGQGAELTGLCLLLLATVATPVAAVAAAVAALRALRGRRV